MRRDATRYGVTELIWNEERTPFPAVFLVFHPHRFAGADRWCNDVHDDVCHCTCVRPWRRRACVACAHVCNPRRREGGEGVYYKTPHLPPMSHYVYARPTFRARAPLNFTRARSRASLISARITFNNPENGALCLSGTERDERCSGALAKDKSYYVFVVKRCPARNITHSGRANGVICARTQK